MTSRFGAHYDEPWKDAIEAFFEEFVSFYFPDVHRGIDWRHAPRFLDKEFQQIAIGDSVQGRVYVDKLVSVCLLGGEEEWIYIHCEVQGQADSAFAQRMFTYFYRLTKLLLKRQWERERIRSLLAVLDWLLWLPGELEDKLYYEIKDEQEADKMQCIPYVERKALQQGIEQGIERGIEQGIERGIEKGIERGHREGRAELLLHVLRHRFGEPNASIVQRVRQADEKQILEWTDLALDAAAIDDVFGMKS